MATSWETVFSSATDASPEAHLPVTQQPAHRERRDVLLGTVPFDCLFRDDASFSSLLCCPR